MSYGITYGHPVYSESSGKLSRKHLKRLLVASSAHSPVYQPSYPVPVHQPSYPVPVHQPSYPVVHAPLSASNVSYYSSRSLSHHAVSHEAMRYGSTATTAPMTFYSNPICPFAHRVWLSLLETRTPHEFKHVPLDESGAGREWYTPIYRAALGADLDPDSFGAVPVIRDGDLLMAESAPISRYVFAKSSMRPSAEQDARTSIFMDQVAGNIIGPWYGLIQAQTAPEQEKAKQNLLGAIKAISSAYERSTGPFFFGPTPSYADFHWFPWAHRLGVLHHYRGFAVPDTPEFVAYHRAVAAISALSSAAQSARPTEFFVEAYKGYANPSH